MKENIIICNLFIHKPYDSFTTMQLMFCVTGTSRNFLNIFLQKILKLLLLQNINTILYDFMLSNLQINIVNANFNKKVETLTVQWSYTQYLY